MISHLVSIFFNSPFLQAAACTLLIGIVACVFLSKAETSSPVERRLRVLQQKGNAQGRPVK